MPAIEVDFTPASPGGRFATARENTRIILFIAVLIGVWIKRAVALLALLAAAH